ncbi:hypothetical protein [Candidatus Tisiphia endosymbiont of Oplodontha viridula]|uniref:hypothetical protein n=1 Tax=Candidatus Tisiphia endosymbiont of Oplodontha viridula TaxID=3077925 RepID=UPI0035C8E44A
MLRHDHLNNYQLVMLAYRVKKAIETGDSSYGGNDMFIDIKNKLLGNIRRLLWNSGVQMESRQHPGYVLDLSTDGSNSDLIYGWPNHHGNNQKWRVNVIDNGRYFQFTSDWNRRALGALEGTREVENPRKKGFCFSWYACHQKRQQPSYTNSLI